MTAQTRTNDRNPDMVTPTRNAWRVSVVCAALCAVAAVLAAMLPAAAHAQFGYDAANSSATSSTAQAGGHPDVNVKFRMATGANGVPFRNTRTVITDMPPGLVGNPTNLATCDMARVLQSESPATAGACPRNSAVGYATVELAFPYNAPGKLLQRRRIYRVATNPGEAAAFGVAILTNPSRMVAKVRSDGSYGLTLSGVELPESQSLYSFDATFWGVPADRQGPGDGTLFDGHPLCPGCANDNMQFGGPLTGAERKPFLSNPTQCTGKPLTTTLGAVAWAVPAAIAQPVDLQTPAITGCEHLHFDPEVTVRPVTRRAATPSGYQVDIKVPQTDDGALLATPHLRNAVVRLPQGVAISPSSANGLSSCTDAQLNLRDTETAERCALSSKIGTVTIDSPLVDNPLEGSVYIGEQLSKAPESGQMFRMFVTAYDAASGVRIKLRGSVAADPTTGRLTASFLDNPQLPFSKLSMTLKDGPRAPLVNPGACGSFTTHGDMTPWSTSTATTAISSFPVDQGCEGAGQFGAKVAAGTVNPAGGAFSPLVVSVTRPDGHSDVNGLSMTLPKGLLAKLKGNVNTQVGSVTAYAGPGAQPFALPGKVFLEGPYGDAPFSLRVVVPAKAGPFDLGEVVVRQKIYVDPLDAHVTVVSDPIPTIVGGVPTRLQRLDINVDKPGFVVNPTSCEATEIKATLGSATGQTVPITNRFQVGDCAGLDLEPKLAMEMTGRKETADGKHPGVRALLVQPQGQANMRKVSVKLPLSLALDPDNAQSLCEFTDGSKVDPTCPKGSIVGKATAVTPILDEPLTGPVYFVKNIRRNAAGREIRTMPKLVMPLQGQGVKLTLTATSAVDEDDGRLVTTFDAIPDAPVSAFALDIDGGKHGILAVTGGEDASICKQTNVAEQQVDGQNGKTADTEVFMATPCPVKVLRQWMTRSGLKVRVGGVGAGRLTVSGPGLRTTRRTIQKSTVATVTVPLTRSGKRAYRGGKKIAARVSFNPTGPAKAKTARASVRKAKPRARSSALGITGLVARLASTVTVSAAR